MKRIVYASAALALAACAGAPSTPGSGRGYLAVSANDNKVVLEKGTVKVVPNAAPDTVALIDLRAAPPRIVAESRTWCKRRSRCSRSACSACATPGSASS